MMKQFLALTFLVSSSAVFASYTPLVEVSTSNDKTIHVVIVNDSGVDLICKYSVSWFVNMLSFRKEFGRVNLMPSGVAELAYQNDQFSRLSRINAKAICE
ncbi:MAG: hypothetical protein PHY93_09645 [Bacteriovorax sp.]|nr:hypothetical protein [Bacteriovorax sp.]